MDTIYLLPIILLSPFVLLAIVYLDRLAQYKRLVKVPVKVVHTSQGKTIKALYKGRYVTVKVVNRCKIRRI